MQLVVRDDGRDRLARLGRDQRGRGTASAPHGGNAGLQAGGIAEGFGLKQQKGIDASRAHQRGSADPVKVAHGKDPSGNRGCPAGGSGPAGQGARQTTCTRAIEPSKPSALVV